MPYLLSASHVKLPHLLSQEKIMEFSREIFGASFKNIERLLKAFKNGQVENRYFSNDLDWFKEDHSFADRNDLYIQQAIKFGKEAIEKCLANTEFLKEGLQANELDAFFFISSTGIATPTIDARIMNELTFNPHAKRIPIWGLGCAGGASGLSRAFEYCQAYPTAKVIVLSVELCSLTFQRNDISKSNLIGTSLFSDGVSCVLVCGDEVPSEQFSKKVRHLQFLDSQSTLMPDSLDVMGWDVKDQGLYVIFSKDIPTIIKDWLKPNVQEFLMENGFDLNDVKDFIAHPGGKKVIDAYHEALGFDESMTAESMSVLREFGNMSSATILYVLERFMQRGGNKGEVGLAAALGPGFSSELVLMRWK
ncbi:3-oxoacyl-[acyl-carrier-protein] synthase III C-terminal domain-containing protein [Peribacillus frigoritolerans]|jgi:alkylresorcinol/alkylpyrone synthase|uniref:type III polyketide synthase n=1 Tax=Peribacillus frigoritolerans TaxID=450367 RepID=UPI002E20DCA8|nr:3-oxoacyl-[acyl-carrier-protein] synthase III C-terminal domain-containing protein [Peribacillus frigoritolerans]MED3833420.1 3-oxoacyl-[acyl-carrier-protein] synthase III C-terminal domain-containing protein [Peribacillus frigoritolerans]MED3848118.1 3-oxoacyl-[acyl-carrier-protein] synthase III C-terminal domain-containing protein [Peribacillus frigoritolerans]WVN09143.1 3-oxoacyl-[acyl-carrier-protein] synthase III C-terminal domain-containing protein [Peribacillus frigoritolerans]